MKGLNRDYIYTPSTHMKAQTMRTFFILAVSLLMTGALAMGHAETEEPKYEIIHAEGAFEIRQYAPKILAEVEVTGAEREASNLGFRPLADYIFGNNTRADEIAMTSPVTQKASTKIEMTAPVTQQESGNETWTVSFVMPSEWTMETLPKPNNPNVTLREAPAVLVAAVRFNGRGRGQKQAKKDTELRAWITSQGYQINGPASAAFYDPPWTLPPLRRNEVLIPVAKPD